LQSLLHTSVELLGVETYSNLTELDLSKWWYQAAVWSHVG